MTSLKKRKRKRCHFHPCIEVKGSIVVLRIFMNNFVEIPFFSLKHLAGG